MKTQYTIEALNDLNAIWEWNAQQYGNKHADAYIQFLTSETDQSDHTSGRPVPAATSLRYRLIQKRKKKHGNVAVFQLLPNEIVPVLRYFHTAQDWPLHFSSDSKT